MPAWWVARPPIALLVLIVLDMGTFRMSRYAGHPIGIRISYLDPSMIRSLCLTCYLLLLGRPSLS